MIIDPADPNFDAEKAYFNFRAFLLKEDRITCLTYFTEHDVHHWLSHTHYTQVDDSIIKNFMLIWELTGFVKHAEPWPGSSNFRSWWEGLK